jgi:hypothetical protein
MTQHGSTTTPTMNTKTKTIKSLRKFKHLSAKAITMLIRLACIIAVAIGVVIVVMGVAQAEPRHRSNNRKSHNYILERQEAYQVQGVPTSRIIVGKREIDVYPNGQMFEKNNLVGVRSR